MPTTTTPGFCSMASRAQEGLYAEKQSSKTMLNSLQDGLCGPRLPDAKGFMYNGDDTLHGALRELVRQGRHIDLIVAELTTLCAHLMLTQGAAFTRIRTRPAREVRIVRGSAIATLQQNPYCVNGARVVAARLAPANPLTGQGMVRPLGQEGEDGAFAIYC